MDDRHPIPPENGRRMLVSGATGFIGGNLVREALRRGFSVRVLARDRRRAEELGPVEVFEADLRDASSLEGVERDVDVVVHCAGLLGKWGMEDAAVEAINVGGSLALLERFAEKTDCRYIHLSAGGVTGPVSETSVDETYACRPATAYERTKLAGEQQVLARAATLGISAAVVRPTFTYGPGDPHKLALFRAVKRGRFAFIDHGRSVLHPVYIDDAVAGTLLAVDRAHVGEVYIVGGERPVAKRELIHAIADALGVARPSRSVPRSLAWPIATVFETVGRALGFEPVLTRSRVMMMGDNFGYSIEKARRELGYSPSTDLIPGIRRTVEAYRSDGLL